MVALFTKYRFEECSEELDKTLGTEGLYEFLSVLSLSQIANIMQYLCSTCAMHVQYMCSTCMVHVKKMCRTCAVLVLYMCSTCVVLV